MLISNRDRFCSQISIASLDQPCSEVVSDREQRIHKYLEENGICMVDIHSYIKDWNNRDCKSPVLAEEFRRINSD